MSLPMGPCPTVREFVAEAVKLGCHDMRTAGEITGPRGSFNAHYLKSANGRGFVILPQDESERLTPTTMANYARILRVYPYIELYQHLIDWFS